jgi:hypothetical protein
MLLVSPGSPFIGARYAIIIIIIINSKHLFCVVLHAESIVNPLWMVFRQRSKREEKAQAQERALSNKTVAMPRQADACHIETKN